jgi:hypothetical protein
MPYVKTRPRLDFEAWEKQAIKIVKKAKSLHLKNADISHCLICAALFLTHARFENYFKDVVKYLIDEISNRGLMSVDLPGRLRETHLLSSLPHQDLKIFYLMNDEKRILDHLYDSLKIGEWTWARNDHVGKLVADKVLGNFGYPSSDNIRRAFYKVGINIFAELGKRLRTDAVALLDSISGLRSEMAHVGMPPMITPGDIQIRINDLMKLVNSIDRVIQKEVRKIK